MNKRRRRRASAWPRIVAAVAALIAVVLLLALAVRLFSGAIRLTRSQSAGRDPQFAEPAEAVTRPPELEGEGEAPQIEEDPSAGWDLGEQTPVDKTAEELAREESD